LISWRWKDLEPQENIRVVAMSPYSWQELHNNYQKTIENPQDAEAWFNLARILDSLSGRYDYNESCSLPTGGYPFKTIKQWSYAQQAVLAYRNAIDLEPDWADPQENLALLLASISLSGNNGKIQLFYPSTRQAVQEFERALVIKPDSYTQQALIDFQRCASEGCQCGY
jgi:tetratricopeptide (TPR) repeat protein